MANSKKNSKNKHKTKKKTSAIGSFFTNIVLMLFAAFLALGFVSWQGLLSPLPFTQKNQVLNVKSGQTYYGLIDDWGKQGKIKYPDLAKVYVRYFIKKPLLAGAYEIPSQASLSTVLNRIARGEQAQMIRISIIEGKTFKDLLAKIAQTKAVEHTLEKEYAGDVGEHNLMHILNLKEEHPEGWFAPNTYYFSHGTSDKAILQHLYKAQKRILDAEWQKRAPNLPYSSPYDALIMASIIEKETGVPEEREKVASVFVNRLNKGMRLQTDPTVIYGMGARYDGNIRKKDLLEKTPYNTYRIDGLPPTPIALPGQASIHAALHPADTQALFFVATGNGGHVFTKTYVEHERAVAAYLKTMRKKRSQAQAQQRQSQQIQEQIQASKPAQRSAEANQVEKADNKTDDKAVDVPNAPVPSDTAIQRSENSEAGSKNDANNPVDNKVGTTDTGAETAGAQTTDTDVDTKEAQNSAHQQPNKKQDSTSSSQDVPDPKADAPPSNTKTNQNLERPRSVSL